MVERLTEPIGRMQGHLGLADDRLIVGRVALLVIDMQHDFMDADAACYNIGAEKTIPPTAELLAAFRDVGLPVIFTREMHRPGRVDAGLEADPALDFAALLPGRKATDGIQRSAARLRRLLEP